MTVLAAASGSDVAPGALGFIVVFGMAVVMFFLFRSMSRHLRKVNAAAARDKAAEPPQSGSDQREDSRPAPRP